MATSSQKNASSEHERVVNLCVDKFKGQKVIIKGNKNIKGQYFPDVIKGNIDIEVEVLPKAYINKKIEKWDKNRKKILVCAFSDQVLENFDEIYLNWKDQIIKVSE
jgi:hypothetical protein